MEYNYNIMNNTIYIILYIILELDINKLIIRMI